MDVKFADVTITDPEIRSAVDDILTTGSFINGPWNSKFIEAFEQQFSEGCKVAPVSSGSAALTVALRVAADKSKPYVVIPDYSFAATLFSVIEADYWPMFCPVDSHGLMDVEQLRELIAENSQDIAAIIPVHLYGQKLILPTDICEEFTIIEDACQAHGVVRSPQADAMCFSFYPSKNLGAGGDAGAVVSKNEELIANVRRYCNYGDYPGVDKYKHSIMGSNMRMDEIQAAILTIKLQRKSMGATAMQRRDQAWVYDEAIKTIAHLDGSSFHLYPILVHERERVAEFLRNNGIETGCHYPYTLPQIYKVGFAGGHAQTLAQHELSLPIGSQVADIQQEAICDIFESCFEYDSIHSMYTLKEGL